MFIRVMSTRVMVSFCILVLAMIVGLFGFNFGESIHAETAYSSDNLLRLHILANSNSPSDQDLKLQVRDAVLLAAHEIFSGVASREEAIVYITNNWESMRKIALDTVSNEGFSYDVSLELGNYVFPDRNYGDFLLPAGHYDALRIVIGEGRGENWWCVLFPPLCFVSMDDDKEMDKLVSVATHLEAGDIEFRWKLWDHLRKKEYASTLQQWWQASLNGAHAVSLPLLKF